MGTSWDRPPWKKLSTRSTRCAKTSRTLERHDAMPMFETGAAKYAWLNNVALAVGIYRPTVGKIVYRVYEIL